MSSEKSSALDTPPFPIPLHRASVSRIFEMMCITFTPEYDFMAGITFLVACHSRIPNQFAIPVGDFSGA